MVPEIEKLEEEPPKPSVEPSMGNGQKQEQDQFEIRFVVGGFLGFSMSALSLFVWTDTEESVPSKVLGVALSTILAASLAAMIPFSNREIK